MITASRTNPISASQSGNAGGGAPPGGATGDVPMINVGDGSDSDRADDDPETQQETSAMSGHTDGFAFHVLCFFNELTMCLETF